MIALVLAILIALLAIFVFVVVLSFFGLDRALASQISSPVLAFVPSIREALDKQFARRSPEKSIHLLSLSGFELAPHLLILCGSLILVASMLFASGFAGILAGVATGKVDVKSEQLYEVIGLLSTFIVCSTAFLVGRWVGRRSRAHGLLTIALIAVVSRTAASIMDYVLMSGEALEAMLKSLYDGGSVLQRMAVQWAYGATLFFAAGAVGYWRGRRQQLGSYLGYLLKNVSPATRHAIVELAFEEAARASGEKTAHAHEPEALGRH